LMSNSTLDVSWYIATHFSCSRIRLCYFPFYHSLVMLPLRLLLIAISFAFLGLADKRCDNGPCEEGCCSPSGWCGFGPDCESCGCAVLKLSWPDVAVCGETCVSECDRKSQCNPGFGSEWAKRDKCPLNVCCSKDGYCGVRSQESASLTRLLTWLSDNIGILWRQKGRP
jgi:hypothetical protein